MSTGGGIEDFDRYCEEHDIQPDELGPAFAAWLNQVSGGEWDGRAEAVEANQ